MIFKIIIKRSILSFILFKTLFAVEFLDDSMNINYIPVSSKSNGMGGVYLPYSNNNKFSFSYLSKYVGLYELNSVEFNYKKNKILFVVHGISDIPNTTNAWLEIGNDAPNPEDINYSQIDYFDVKDFNLVISKLFNKNYMISIKNTFSKNYNEYGIGLGVNLILTQKKIKNINYHVGIYDFISFKRWSTSRIEYYKPKLMASIEYPFFNSLNIFTLYFDDKVIADNNLMYRLGTEIILTNNLKLFLGNSNLTELSIGFSMNNKFFNVDYSYTFLNNDLIFNNYYNLSIGINIVEFSKKSKDFYP